MSVKLKACLKHAQQLTLFISISLITGTAYSGIYKWVDEQGNVHYGQERPANAPAERMQVQRHAPRDTSSYKKPGQKNEAAENQADETETEKTAEQEKPAKKTESKAEKKRRLAECAKARKNLATMESRGRIRSKDKDGNTSYLTQKQKEARMKRGRDLISKHCK